MIGFLNFISGVFGRPPQPRPSPFFPFPPEPPAVGKSLLLLRSCVVAGCPFRVGVCVFFLPPLALAGLRGGFVLNVVVKKEEGQHQVALNVKFFESPPGERAGAAAAAAARGGGERAVCALRLAAGLRVPGVFPPLVEKLRRLVVQLICGI